MKSLARDRLERDTDRPDNRQHRRRSTAYPVIVVHSDRSEHSGVCRNIGLGGLRIETAEPGSIGEEVTIVIELEEIDEPVRLPGTIRWTKGGSVGVQLGSIGVRVTNAILAIVAAR